LAAIEHIGLLNLSGAMLVGLTQWRRSCAVLRGIEATAVMSCPLRGMPVGLHFMQSKIFDQALRGIMRGMNTEVFHRRTEGRRPSPAQREHH
jgi:hypothetical protein